MKSPDIFYKSLKKFVKSQQSQKQHSPSKFATNKPNRNKLGLPTNDQNLNSKKQLNSASPGQKNYYYLPSLSKSKITNDIGGSTNLTIHKSASISRSYYDNNRSLDSSSNESYTKTKFVKIEEFSDNNQERVHVLIQSENSIKYLLRKRNPDEAMLQMNEIVNTIIETNDIDLLAESFDLIADIAITARDFKNALNAYNKIRQLGQYSKNNDLKVSAILKISDLCKFLKKYDIAKLFLKRALQYTWLDKKEGLESNIYDKLGMIYFLEGNMEKAKQFHQRSVGFVLEEDQSPAKKHSIESLKIYKEEQQFNTQKINRMLLAKLGMIGEKAVSGQQNEYKLFTNVDFELQVEQIKEDEDVNNIIGTPQNGKQCRTINGYILPEFYDLFEKKVVSLHKNMEKNKYFKKQQVRLQQQHFMEFQQKKEVKIDNSLLKREIEDKISKRKEDKLQEQSSVEKFKKEVQHFVQVRPIFERNNGIYYHNHLSPNRNIDGFSYCHKPCNKKITGLCNKLKQKLIYQ